MFGVTLRSTKDIAGFYLVYSAFILGLGVLSAVIEASKVERSRYISAAINSSLLRLTVLASFNIITAAFGATITLPELCHLSLWILIAELNQVACQIFFEREVMASWSYFGKTIEAMIVIGQLSRFLEVNPFDFIWGMYKKIGKITRKIDDNWSPRPDSTPWCLQSLKLSLSSSWSCAWGWGTSWTRVDRYHRS